MNVEKEIEKYKKEGYRIIAAGVILDRNKGIYIVKRSDKRRFFPGYWAVPSGRMEKGENIKETLKRELKEETGCEVRDIIKFLGKIEYKNLKNVVYVYLVTVSGRPRIDLKEHVDEAWVKNLEDLQKYKFPPKFRKMLERALEYVESTTKPPE